MLILAWVRDVRAKPVAAEGPTLGGVRSQAAQLDRGGETTERRGFHEEYVVARWSQCSAGEGRVLMEATHPFNPLVAQTSQATPGVGAAVIPLFQRVPAGQWALAVAAGGGARCFRHDVEVLSSRRERLGTGG